MGVGGFTLGGGTYPFANKYGWALDNVYEYEVVLSNSSIVTASEDTNPDLYFALRGGANNFGIISRFTCRSCVKYDSVEEASESRRTIITWIERSGKHRCGQDSCCKPAPPSMTL